MSDFERHEGQIHDRVDFRDGDEWQGDITVLAGDNEADTISLLSHWAGCAGFDVRMTVAQARRLGSLLLSAAADTASRPVTPKDVGTDEEAAS